jgi:hypothetical protein
MSGEQLTGVYRNHAGEIISFLTSEGRVISYRKALAEAEEGVITGVNVQETADSNNALNFNLPNINELPDIY